MAKKEDAASRFLFLIVVLLYNKHVDRLLGFRCTVTLKLILLKKDIIMQQLSQIQTHVVELIKSLSPQNIDLSTVQDGDCVNKFLPYITSSSLSSDVLDIISDAEMWWDIVFFTGDNDNGWEEGIKAHITRWNYDNELEMFFFHIYQGKVVREFCITKDVLAQRACVSDNFRGGFTPSFVKVDRALEVLDEFFKDNLKIE